MKKTNKRRYLIFGIISFIAILYLLVKFDVIKCFSSDNSHTVKICSISVIENNSVDSVALKKFNEGIDSAELIEHFIPHYYYSVINKVDNVSYAKSEIFDDKDPLEYYTVRFKEKSFIPQYTLNEKYHIDVFQSKRIVATFTIKSFSELLDLENKANYLTEEKQVEIISTTQKIKILVKFIVD
jgi:hypothetical protein